MLPDYYSYTATFTPDEDGWLVEFPDLERCATNADSLEEAIVQANNILEDYIAFLERNNRPIPEPTPYDDIELPKNGSKQRIVVLMREARLRWRDKKVKRTITIPAWIDQIANAEGINLSLVLQETLTRRFKRKNTSNSKIRTATA